MTLDIQIAKKVFEVFFAGPSTVSVSVALDV